MLESFEIQKKAARRLRRTHQQSENLRPKTALNYSMDVISFNQSPDLKNKISGLIKN